MHSSSKVHEIVLVGGSTRIPRIQSLLSDYFNAYVGLVSGKEEVYKNKELGNISVLRGENCHEKYILIDKYPSGNQSSLCESG